MMFRAVSAQFVTRQGDTFNPRINLTDAAGTPLDTTGMKVEYRMIRTLGSAEELIERTRAGGGVTVVYDAAAGVSYVQPVISKTDSADIDPGKYRFELRIEDAAGNRGTALVGTHTIERQIDR